MILPYVQLWPGAQGVTTEILMAAVATPAALGCEGVIVWGSSSDAHVSGYCDSIGEYIRSTAGPLLQQCKSDRQACRRSRCSGHGQCASWDADHAEMACDFSSAAAIECICDFGFSGADCSTDTFNVPTFTILS